MSVLLAASEILLKLRHIIYHQRLSITNNLKLEQSKAGIATF